MKQLIRLTEKGLIPDFLVRLGIKKLLRERLFGLCLDNCEKQLHLQNQFLTKFSESNIAEVPDKANEQHYELPVSFFEQVLGPHLKYSCDWWDSHISFLEYSEVAALERTCENAELLNRQTVLELG